VRLRLEAEGFRPGEEVVLVAPAGETTVELRLERPAAPAVLTGLVRGDDGRPVAATISVVELSLRARADARGSFSLSLPPGKYTLRIEAPGFSPQRKRVDLTAGEQSIHDVDLHRERP
jgi:hypothetical protein